MKPQPATNFSQQASREARICQYYVALASRQGTVYAESYDVAVDAVDLFERKTKEAREKI